MHGQLAGFIAGNSSDHIFQRMIGSQLVASPGNGCNLERRNNAVRFFMRLMIVAQGVRDSVQSAIVDVATENWDEAYCMELFGENVQIAAASHDLFAKRVNGQIYRPLVEKYIAGEKRL